MTLANDGGVGHLAAASGCPVVSVFGPSNDRAWAPLGAMVVAADFRAGRACIATSRPVCATAAPRANACNWSPRSRWLTR